MADEQMPEIPEIVTRADAVARGLKQYFSGKPCVNGHLSVRATVNGTCAKCSDVRHGAWASRNTEAVRRNYVAHVARDPDGYRAKARAGYERNKDGRLAACAAWAAANPETSRKIKSDWKKRNPHNGAVSASRRRAKKLNATPLWVDHNEIANLYAECARLTKETGEMHHVDHIYPLISPLVCGLHVHTNMRVIPAPENFSKNNRMPDEAVTRQFDGQGMVAA